MEIQVIQSKIYEVRGARVMLDFDLARLYQVETRTLKQAVRRNIERFPDDFMFRLSPSEANYLIDMGVSQIVIPPGYNVGATEMFAFTEQGVSMLSAVLRSPVATQASISIMRAFVAMRNYIANTSTITAELAEIRATIEVLRRDSDETLEAVNDLSEDTRKHLDNLYNAIGELSVKPAPEPKTRRRIGFNSGDE
ncbi:MAG: ORF6N domain-containing protein [Rikenellaceae bacterium]|jgi:hypothetical protein|nr:ORF6N domain-containing protein [Rikenellaceae bacterium]